MDAKPSLPESLRGRDFIRLSDLSAHEVDALIRLAFEMKQEQKVYSVPNKTLIMLFFNYSLRTRASFEIGARQLGINSVIVNPQAEGWKLEWREGVAMLGEEVEHAKDAAKVLSRYGDAIALRTYPPMLNLEDDRKDPLIDVFRKYASVPVINLESAQAHPCQGLADLMTLRELFPAGVKGKKVTLAWAPHPKPLTQSVSNSFVEAAALDGANIVVTHPPGYDLDSSVLKAARKNAEARGGSLTVTNDRDAAFDGAVVVYGKSWVSTAHYGLWERETKEREKFGDRWRITSECMARTHRAKFMHPLPIRRNVVCDDDVVDGPDCVVYQQSENRLHVQKALMVGLLS